MKNALFWILAFSGVLALGIIVLFVIGDTTPSLFNFPSWLLYFFGVEIIFCVVFYLFTQFYWQTEE